MKDLNWFPTIIMSQNCLSKMQTPCLKGSCEGIRPKALVCREVSSQTGANLPPLIFAAYNWGPMRITFLMAFWQAHSIMSLYSWHIIPSSRNAPSFSAWPHHPSRATELSHARETPLPQIPVGAGNHLLCCRTINMCTRRASDSVMQLGKDAPSPPSTRLEAP